MSALTFRNICAILLNIDRHDLEAAGVMRPNQVGGCDWTRFNDDPLIFVLKLPPERLERLWNLIERRNSRS